MHLSKACHRQASLDQKTLFPQPVLGGVQHPAAGAHGHARFLGHLRHRSGDIFKLKGDNIDTLYKAAHGIQVGIRRTNFPVRHLTCR